jgi:hypothetical protein
MTYEPPPNNWKDFWITPRTDAEHLATKGYAIVCIGPYDGGEAGYQICYRVKIMGTWQWAALVNPFNSLIAADRSALVEQTIYRDKNDNLMYKHYIKVVKDGVTTKRVLWVDSHWHPTVPRDGADNEVLEIK